MSPDKGNGNNRAKLATHEAKIDAVVEDVSEIKSMLKRMFEPNGVCDKRAGRVGGLEKRVAANASWIKALWGVAIPVLLLLAKIAFF